MNNFTKDELELIQDNLSWEECQEKNRKLMTINNKLTNMIDNYCEHECHHEWDGILVSESPNTGKCKKCGIICYIALKV